MTSAKPEPIFHRARALSDPGERASFLDGACGSDVALRAKVEALLKADAEAGQFMESVSPEAGANDGATMRDPIHHERPGQRIDRYKLLQPIGEGGFGTVWLAEQREPVRRRVALKIIKLGMDTKQVIARFEAERQALAMMDHPNIARVLDAGSTDSGRPYFVMEYIKGVPIVEYCDTEKLDTAARLGLLATTCNAIQHAHQKGIIHRDIKPGNVLVTLHDGKPVPMVIDFGIAKATNAELTSKTLFTEHSQMIGTPAYMSPEQAEMSGLDIDTRADIYSLGVLLYELLTGTTPFNGRSLLEAGYAEMMRVIREEEPHKPSTRVSTLGDAGSRAAQSRHTSLHGLSLALKGDLDWIVMKCLEKDRTRRYDTAHGLADDILRHLSDEPVLAGPPGTAYRLRKFVKRNRAKVLTGGVIAALLVLGVVGTSAALARAMRAERLALAQRDAASSAERRTAKVVEFLQDMIGQADPHSGRRPDFTMRQALDEAAGSLGVGLRDAPEIEADIRMSIGSAYRHLGELDLAEEHFHRALTLRQERFGEQHAEVASSLAGLAGVAHDRGVYRRNRGQSPLSEYQESARSYRAALAMREALLGERHLEVVDTLARLSGVLRSLGELDEAEPTARRAVALATELVGEEGAATLGADHELALVLQAQGRLDEAESLLTRTLELRKRVLGPESRDTLNTMSDLARLLTRVNRFDEAERVVREKHAIQLRTLGEGHPDTLKSLVDLAWNLQMQGRLADCEPLLREIHGIRARTQGEGHRDTLGAQQHLAVVIDMQGRHAESEPLLREVYEAGRRDLGEEHQDTLTNEALWADSLEAQGRYEESGTLLREVYEVSRRTLGPEHENTQGFLYRLARNRLQAGLFAEAEPLFAKLLAHQRRVLGAESPGTLFTAAQLGLAVLNQGRLDEAERLLNESLQTQRRVLGEGHEITLFTRSHLGLVSLRRGRYAEAEAALVDAAERIDLPRGAGPLRLEMMQPAYERVIELYEAWDAAEGGRDHALAAETWRSRLSLLQGPG